MTIRHSFFIINRNRYLVAITATAENPVSNN